MVWRATDPQGNEAAKIAPLIVPYTRGRGLDIGCGQYKAFPHFIGVDSGKDYGRPVTDITTDAGDLTMFVDASMDFVFSSHVLEHTVDPLTVLNEWWRVIKVGGHLVLYLPDKRAYPNIGKEGANPDHKHDFLPYEIMKMMRKLGAWTQLEDEYRNDGTEYSFFQVYRKEPEDHPVSLQTIKPWERSPEGKPRCLLIRYGGFGDMIQAASVIPELKKMGYHVTVNTTPRGHDMLKHDPNVDAFMIQDNDQVPNGNLGAYWHRIGERYDRVINLCESVEGSLLALPGRINHEYPDDVRRKLLGVNYLERTHDIAGVPHEFHARFHPSEEEKAWAIAERAKMGKVVVLITMAGSSVHKAYPWMHLVIEWLMKNQPDVHVVTTGDKLCEMLEIATAEALKIGKVLPSRIMTGWTKTCGRWSIRETLAFAQVCDIAVGPETGVLNAVGIEDDVAKVVMLSHSSVENLTKHWKATASLLPAETIKCYPCHRMHYDRTFCPQDDKSGASICAASIDPRDVIEMIMRFASQRLGTSALIPAE